MTGDTLETRERLAEWRTLAEIATEESVNQRDFDAICDAFPQSIALVESLTLERAAALQTLEETQATLERMSGKLATERSYSESRTQERDRLREALREILALTIRADDYRAYKIARAALAAGTEPT